MAEKKCDRVVCVIVTYLPEASALLKLIENLSAQVDAGLLVNNGPSLQFDEAFLKGQRFEIRHMGGNQGVASALNAGFRWAEEMCASHVLTMDQDSQPALDMVAALKNALVVLGDRGFRLGAVGPQSVDFATGRPAPFVLPVNGKRHSQVLASGDLLEVEHLITSGCLIPMAAWRDTGPFLESLFIDYVDIEWCMRARSRGWIVFGVGDAVLRHSLGDRFVKWGRRQLPWHQPIRHYYLFRNAIAMQRMRYIPRSWKRVDARLLFKRFVFIAITAGWRLGHVRAMLLGVWDGLLGRGGRTDRHL